MANLAMLIDALICQLAHLESNDPADLSQVDDKDDDDCLVPSYPYPLFQNEEDRLRKSLAMKPNQAIFLCI